MPLKDPSGLVSKTVKSSDVERGTVCQVRYLPQRCEVVGYSGLPGMSFFATIGQQRPRCSGVKPRFCGHDDRDH